MSRNANPDENPEMFPELYSPAPPPTEMAAMAGSMSEVAPGVWCCGLPELEAPSHILCRLVPAAEPGTYTLVPEPYPGFVRMQENIGPKLGLIGLSDTTMRRLLAIGFIEHARPAIGMIMISIESLLDHLRRTKNDLAKDASWWTPDRRTLWRTIIDSGTNLVDGY